jgi:hypothetical protein
MNVNGKMRTVETVPGMGGKGIKRMAERLNSHMTYLIYCKNFCKCHSISPPSTIK